MSSPEDHIMLLDDSREDNQRSGFKNFTFNFDSAAGIRYTVDVTKPEGEKISIECMADGSPFDLDREYRVAVNSYRGNGGGDLLTKGAGIPAGELKSRIIQSTDKDLRFYMMKWIEEQGSVNPQALNLWKFVPEEFVAPAIERDRKILFGE
jgi:2',3'-cyclic-nucleotide 2'-phosphodiesterase/3'-nucleotidase